ncbi:ectonucleotide pyrophosphatase/phosphodiesterase [Peptoniphilus equinus]|uniref:Ectonucleotide pyrophosphatase/phosphodiesterase n=1 Tax=Peptoniphilus equinus TaxID=3016343 RepID=A0ABY7QV51_9FIRM|nr:ectonucleotide pyrophosphatase/phosphodiesterase [Peptoniphilus equinus]WBW49915.1 ectonucleotide pyrophosphatase/phosphodiesterase [Peptoniphilus equinus]
MRPLFIISLDALGDTDEAVYKDIPFFKKAIEHGTWIRKFTSIYPTLTYPVHATIVTGRYPDTHGIVNNLKLQPEKLSMDWYWDEPSLQGDSIFRAAHRRGLSTCALCWPVSADGPIDYNLPEIWPRSGESYLEFITEKSSEGYVNELTEAIDLTDSAPTQPEIDDYIVKAALHTFKAHKPDITLMHIVQIDGAKHKFGPYGKEVDAAICTVGQRLETLFQGIDEVTTDYDVMILSDHNQLPTHSEIRLNAWLAAMGYLQADEDGMVASYRAIFFSGNGSAALYAENDNVAAEIEMKLREADIAGIKTIYSTADVPGLRVDPTAKLYVEAEAGYVFGQSAKGDVDGASNPTHYRGNHGYHPNTADYGAMGLFFGPSFQEGKVIEEAALIEFAPTVDAMLALGLEGAETEGMDVLK